MGKINFGKKIGKKKETHKSKAILMNVSKFTVYLKKSIQDFSFILISKNDELPYFEKNQLINQNIKNSQVIIIDKNTEKEFIILCFEKTLMIIK